MSKFPKMTTVVALEQGESHYSDVKPVLLNARFRRRCGASWGRSVLLVLGIAVAALAFVAATAISREGVSADDGLLSETLSAGTDHACAISSSGEVTCWGTNILGEADAPTGKFVQLSAGHFFSCGLRESGAVECWGDDSHGAASPPDTKFTSVSAGHIHACGVTLSGSVVCWGSDLFGGASPPPGTYVQVSANSRDDGFTCAVTSTRMARCWGFNNSGQATPPGGEFVQLSAGYEHACGVTSTGSVKCWGGGSDGQSRPPEGEFRQVSAGAGQTCAISSVGHVVCWGYAGGNSNTVRSSPPGTFSHVTVGNSYACGLRTSGAVVCWPNKIWDPDDNETQLPAELNRTGAALQPAAVPPVSVASDTPDANSSASSHYVATAARVEGPTGGMILANEQLVADGGEITLTAIPNPGFRFVRWEGRASGRVNPLTLRPSAHSLVVAIFAPIDARPDSAPSSVDGRIVARLLADGRIEFGFEPEGGERLLPRSRYFPANAGGGWLASSDVVLNGEQLGRITARRLADGRVEFGFIAPDGERILPSSRYFPASASVGRWLRSSVIGLE